MAITINDEPALVNLPSSVIANGHRAGHINEHPTAMKAMNQIEMASGVNTTMMDPKMAKIEQINRAVACEMTRGMKIIPQM